MPVITLPDGSNRQFDSPVSILDVAADIGPGLAKSTLGGRVNGVRMDASDVISEDVELTIFTPRDEDGLENYSSLLCAFVGACIKTALARCKDGDWTYD